ncbi:unnamed protein product [Microthlaspi erraticum]|uniref:RNase H type-1 domain-containing protein n=1 Tax=Microthlaspi erraticum TaxID=1685480 RepID=A0A6D2HY26_9BRAS|nr:unnamed protein product [Microthlaspi erraticum]
MVELRREISEYDDFRLLDIEEEYSKLPYKTLAFFKAAYALAESLADIPLMPEKGPVFTDPKLKWYEPLTDLLGKEYFLHAYGPIVSELWGLYYGLCIAWEKGVTRLEVEVDSSLVVGFMKTGISDTHPLSFLVHLCHGFLAKDWDVRFTHVYRETNRLADGLANYAFSLQLGLHTFDLVPSVLVSVLCEDEYGNSISRHVRV